MASTPQSSEARPLAATAANKPYTPHGAACDLWECNNREVVYSGPVRVGKTRAVCEKAHRVCVMYPGARVLFLRQTKHSMAQTVLLTFERDVLPSGYCFPSEAQRNTRQSYRYLNGSEIVVGGLDDVNKYLSSEFDLICVFQAEECAEEPILTLLTRLCNFKAPFQQLILDVNPRAPSHWIKQRCDAGHAVMLHGRLQDNPRFYSLYAEDWTEEGRQLLVTLSELTGHLRARLVEGKWAHPEGARFADASRLIQGFSLYEIWPQGMPEWFRHWISVDYGKADPYCALWHAIDQDGVIWTYQEDYASGYEADQQAQRVLDKSPIDIKYEGVWLDPSMWQTGEYARGFGAQAGKGSAADQYEAALRDVKDFLGKKREFGGLHKGAQNTHEEAYVTLDSLLRQGKWRIEFKCVNLWNEIESAVHYKDPRTGIVSEEINPGGKKYCSDHALESAGYGIHQRTLKPSVVPVDPNAPFSWDAVYAARAKEQHDAMLKQIQGRNRPRW